MLTSQKKSEDKKQRQTLRNTMQFKEIHNEEENESKNLYSNENRENLRSGLIQREKEINYSYIPNSVREQRESSGLSAENVSSMYHVGKTAQLQAANSAKNANFLFSMRKDSLQMKNDEVSNEQNNSIVQCMKAQGTEVSEIKKAVQWLKSMGWEISEDCITDPTLTSGNCHGLTFNKSNSVVNVELVKDIINLWKSKGEPDIIVCLKKGAVYHSVTRAGELWKQTLPGGPTFLSSLEMLKGKYDCYNMKELQEYSDNQPKGYEELCKIIIDNYNLAINDQKYKDSDFKKLACELYNGIFDKKMDSHYKTPGILEMVVGNLLECKEDV